MQKNAKTQINIGSRTKTVRIARLLAFPCPSTGGFHFATYIERIML